MQFETEILASRNDAAGFHHLKLSRPDNFDFVPGQYVTLAYGNEDKPRFLALASHPTERQLLFISRQEAPPSQQVKISAPQGKGFACDFTLKTPFLFITHGTGISAIRSAALERKRLGHAGDTLLYGAQNAEAEPDVDCLTDQRSLRQLRAHSKVAPRQHVQQILQTLELNQFAAVIIIGSKEMMQSCREIIAEQGFDPAKVFSNY